MKDLTEIIYIGIYCYKDIVHTLYLVFNGNLALHYFNT
jgi:hypothetical protein